MWYAIYATDRAGSGERRKNARPDHIARLTELHNQGRILVAGPFPAIDAEDPGPVGMTGSLIVAEFSDLATAQAWAKEDPYVKADVYDTVTVKPFRKVLP